MHFQRLRACPLFGDGRDREAQETTVDLAEGVVLLDAPLALIPCVQRIRTNGTASNMILRNSSMHLTLCVCMCVHVRVC